MDSVAGTLELEKLTFTTMVTFALIKSDISYSLRRVYYVLSNPLTRIHNGFLVF